MVAKTEMSLSVLQRCKTKPVLTVSFSSAQLWLQALWNGFEIGCDWCFDGISYSTVTHTTESIQGDLLILTEVVFYHSVRTEQVNKGSVSQTAPNRCVLSPKHSRIICYKIFQNFLEILSKYQWWRAKGKLDTVTYCYLHYPVCTLMNWRSINILALIQYYQLLRN